MNRAPLLTPGRGLARPVLGDLCVPGCRVDEVDGDGTHWCVAVVPGTVPAIVGPHGTPRSIAVEVTQWPQPDGSLRRAVTLVVLREDGRYAAADYVELPAAALPMLLELLAAAVPVAGVEQR